jgi:hypothetical protein
MERIDMRKKISLLAMSMVMAIAGLAFVPTPEANAAHPIICHHRTSQAYATAKLPGGKKMAIAMNVAYKACVNKLGPNFARPTDVVVATNVQGASMGCKGANSNAGFLNNGHYETKFTVFFSDSVHRNFRLKTFSTPCSSSTYATRHVKIGSRKSISLYYVLGEAPPKARVNYVVDWRGRRDPVGTTRANLYW